MNKYYLTLVQYDDERILHKFFREGLGEFYLLNDDYKRKMLPNSFFQEDHLATHVPAYSLNKNIPDFLYVVNDKEYVSDLLPKYDQEEIRSKIKWLELFYRYLYANLGKVIEIDPDFEKAGCSVY